MDRVPLSAAPSEETRPGSPQRRWSCGPLRNWAPRIRRTGPLLLLVGALCTPAWATELRLTLTDGSVITGEIESVQNGIYTFRSPSLGTLSLKESDIRRIEMPAGSPSRADGETSKPSAASDPQVEALQRRILADDALMNSVTALLDDPQLQAVLKDPEVLDAFRAGDIDALKGNPKFRSLIDDPKVKEITKRLAQ